MSATHACSEALQGNGLRPGLKPFGEEDETPLELGCKRCHASLRGPTRPKRSRRGHEVSRRRDAAGARLQGLPQLA